LFLNQYAEYINNHILIISEEQINDVKLEFKYEYIPWRYETFPQDLLKCDIALLPRPTGDRYNDGHSSFKALVFAVTGIPIITNKTPSYLDLSHFYDGVIFLEDNDNDLNKCIETLRIRTFNAEKVRKHYSCENQASLLINYLKHQLKNY